MVQVDRAIIDKLKQNEKLDDTDRKFPKLTRHNDTDKRSQFFTDAGRIVFTRAFRRLEHKAQVYSPEKGDHYRTRLTHTMEVVQLSRSIAGSLHLNEDLSEAIALGHDIGHTPFGHQGERVLDEIMNGKNNLGGKIKYNLNFGGFKHNYNSIKILDEIEVKYPKIVDEMDVRGLNLTWQVKEGILKHTSTGRCKPECKQLTVKKETEGLLKRCEECYDLKRFTRYHAFLGKYLTLQRYSCTLEGQIVAIADEIAQRQHDIDDGLRDKHLGLDISKVSSTLIYFIKEITDGKDLPDENFKLLEDLKNKMEYIEKNKNPKLPDERLYVQNAIVREVINYFMLDVIINSSININRITSKDFDIIDGNAIINKEIISFSKYGDAFNDKIEKFINYKIINSETVNKFDGKSIYIIKQLFKAYYTNPRQMPKYELNKLIEKLEYNVKTITPFKFDDDSETYKFSNINDENATEYSNKFDYGKKNDLDRLISLLKLELVIDEIDLNNKDEFIKNYCITKEGDNKGLLRKDILNEINIKSYEDIDKIADETEKGHKKLIKCIIENHYAYMSTICDYISGMTDNFALDQYKELYLT